MGGVVTDLEFLKLLRKHTPNAIFEMNEAEVLLAEATITHYKHSGRVKTLEIDGYTYSYSPYGDTVTEVHKGKRTTYRFQVTYGEYKRLNSLAQREAEGWKPARRGPKPKGYN